MPKNDNEHLIDLSNVSIENDFHITLAPNADSGPVAQGELSAQGKAASERESTVTLGASVQEHATEVVDEIPESVVEEAVEVNEDVEISEDAAEAPSYATEARQQKAKEQKPISAQASRQIAPSAHADSHASAQLAPAQPSSNQLAEPSKDEAQKPKKKMSLGMRILIGVVIGLVAIVIIAIAAFNIIMRVTYSEFYSNAESEFDIPGLAEGFIPQDMDYVPYYDTWLFSGYMGDDSASPIYRRAGDGTVSRIYITRPDGVGYEGHGGGIASDSEHVLITDGSGYLVIGLDDVMAAEEGVFVDAIAYVPIEFTPAFLDIFGGMLYAGNFYDGDNYDSPEKMHVNLVGGGQNCAVMYAFAEDDTSISGWSLTPEEVYSIPDKVQGVCAASNGDFVFSTSWGLGASHLYVYKHPYSDIGDYEYSKLPLMPEGEEVGNQGYTTPSEVEQADEVNEEEPESEFVSVPLYVFSSSDLRKDIKAIPMSEGIQLNGSRVFICNESASDKYFFGKLIGAQTCYSIDVMDYPTIFVEDSA